MSSGQRKSAGQRAVTSVVGSTSGLGVPLAPLLSDAVKHVIMDTRKGRTVIVHGSGERVVWEGRAPVGYFGQIMVPPITSNGMHAELGDSLTRYWHEGASIDPLAEASPVVEATGTVRVLTLQPSGQDSMDPTSVRLAELTRDFPLATTKEWQQLEKELGAAQIFAIESAPLTFDVDDKQQAFTGRARVLAEVLDVAEPHDFVESRVIDARVNGRFENGEPKIQNFAFLPAR